MFGSLLILPNFPHEVEFSLCFGGICVLIWALEILKSLSLDKKTYLFLEVLDLLSK